MLARDTDWRQGDLLTCKAAAALGLVGATDQGHRAIVITHDCDLPHESELCVEVIVAELVVKDPKPDPQLSYAKNPRRLHLAYEGADADPAETNVFMGVCQGHHAESGIPLPGCPPHAEAIMNVVFRFFPDVQRPGYADDTEEAKLEKMLNEVLATLV